MAWLNDRAGNVFVCRLEDLKNCVDDATMGVNIGDQGVLALGEEPKVPGVVGPLNGVAGEGGGNIMSRLPASCPSSAYRPRCCMGVEEPGRKSIVCPVMDTSLVP